MELKGKPLSLGSKILGTIIAVGALVLKATISPMLDIDAAIKVAAFVVIIFAPVDLSMVMGNIFGPLGNRNGPPAPLHSYPDEGGGGR
jgi:predicted phage tail protein